MVMITTLGGVFASAARRHGARNRPAIQKFAKSREQDITGRRKLYDTAAGPMQPKHASFVLVSGQMKVLRSLLAFCLCLLLGPGASASPPARTPPDIFLITIDTLRADHVHCY